MSEIDYGELVQGTVDEVKETVETEGLDPRAVLEAERENKDRVTLVKWLEERVETPETREGMRGNGLARAVNLATSRLFVAGLVIGVAVSFAAVSAGVGPGSGMSPSGVSDHVESYFSANAEGIPLQSMSVESAEKMGGSGLYRLDMVLSAEFLNRTIEQNQTAIVTSNGRYLFLGAQPLDTEQPLAEQLARAQ